MMEITVRKNLVMRSLLMDDAPEVYRIIDSNRAYLRKWLPWIDGTGSPAVIQRVFAKWEQQSAGDSDIVSGILKDGENLYGITHDMVIYSLDRRSLVFPTAERA